MLESQHRTSAATGKPIKAVLLCAENLSPEDFHLTEILDFFGIAWQSLTAQEIFHNYPKDENGDFCILSSASFLAEVLQSCGNSSCELPPWMREANSVFLYGFRETTSCKHLLRLIAGDARAEIQSLRESRASLSITSDMPELCGPMSGMQAQAEPATCGVAFHLTQRNEGFRSIIRSGEGDLFFSTPAAGGVPVYLSGGCVVPDIRSPQSKYFDVKKHFCETVPLVMYLKWAFRDVCWNSRETSGCLVIDDPPLKPRYGFLRYSEALELMDQHNFTTTIAFIPWNWSRTNSRAVGMFRNRSDRLSLCVHGSDHMGSEFATRSTARLDWSLKIAKQRMELLRERTLLPHARVMVFPRGAFSPEAGRALKLNGFVAAVNTEVAPELAENQTTIADLWSMAILKYGTFPIFTRRYLTHGIENFAFDGLLGKPCLIVGHHEAFRNGGHELADFIDKLNALKWNLRWRSLGDVVTRSFPTRNQGDGTKVIHMFAENLVIDNPSADLQEWTVLKEEGDLDCVQAVTVNGRSVDFSRNEKHLRWSVKVPPCGPAEVSVIYFDKPDSAAGGDSVGYRVRTHARRYLSELRDNYLYQSNFLYEGISRIRGFLK